MKYARCCAWVIAAITVCAQYLRVKLKKWSVMKSTYKEVKSDILAKIIKGDWGPGDLVPNEVDLALTYGGSVAKFPPSRR